MSYEFHPAAEQEYLEAIVYYESRQPGLGALLFEEFERAMVLVCESPTSYQTVEESTFRRCLMKRFPYTIFFKEHGTVIQILAVAHQHRRPRYWLGRS